MQMVEIVNLFIAKPSYYKKPTFRYSFICVQIPELIRAERRWVEGQTQETKQDQHEAEAGAKTRKWGGERGGAFFD